MRAQSENIIQALHKGPSLNPELYEIFLKLRIFRYFITADLEKAYLQINVEEKHRNFMRFLWYSDVFGKTPEIEKFRFCRIMFGLTPSQYLLNATIRKHGEKYRKVDPEFARKVKKHFYVDDLNTGFMK